MLKQNIFFIEVTLTILVMFSGCSQSNGYATSKVASNETSVVIHGYTLPPKPDPVINNTTLLGIDSNNNGVRDDIEIWILKKYKDKHPIYTEIAMQAGRAWQNVLKDPSAARETAKLIDAAQNCEFYFRFDAYKYGDTLLIDESIVANRMFDKIVTNTQERKDAYWEYDRLLSGGVYVLPKVSQEKSYCDFNVTKFTKI